MKLSIITINYNNREGLQKTIGSILAQTWRDFEWIVIDGGSTDGSKELIAQYQDHFAYWCSEPDKGVYNAMNKGIAKAAGEWMNFMNSGDCFYDDRTLEKVFSQELKADLVYGDWVRVYPDREVHKEAPKKAFNVTVFFENVCHQAMFIRSGILKEQGYDEEMKILADWKRWIEMAIGGSLFQYIPYTICKFEAGNGLSERGGKQLTDERETIYYNSIPKEISQYLMKYDKLMYNQWEYANNPIISETIRVASQGSSYKTKLIHLTILLIKFLEKIVR